MTQTEHSVNQHKIIVRPAFLNRYVSGNLNENRSNIKQVKVVSQLLLHVLFLIFKGK